VKIRCWLPEAYATTGKTAVELFKKKLKTHGQQKVQIFGIFRRCSWASSRRTVPGNTTAANCVSPTAAAAFIADQIDAANYKDYIGESVQQASYLKSPYYLPLGFPDGIYRVGPLARLNVCERMGVPQADEELKKFKKLAARAVNFVVFLYHYARLIEILAAIEFVEALHWPTKSLFVSDNLRADAGINNLRGVGVTEAPRGTVVPRLHRGSRWPAAKGQPHRRHRPKTTWR